MILKNTIFVLALILFGASCSDQSDVKVSPEMQEFLKMIQGSYEDVSAAMDKYAASDDLKTHNITMYDLDEGKVLSRDGDCYRVEFSAGITQREYKICWKDGKIIDLESFGIK